MRKYLTSILAILLLLSFSGCSQRAAEDHTVHLVSGQTYGTGKYSFELVVSDPDGLDTMVSIKTDKDTLGDALLQLGIVDGEKSDFGLYVKTVNGITLDYDKDQKYWALYVNGEPVDSGIDATPVTDGDVYTLKAE